MMKHPRGNKKVSGSSSPLAHRVTSQKHHVTSLHPTTAITPKPPTDDCHSGSTPCCDIVNSVSMDIFSDVCLCEEDFLTDGKKKKKGENEHNESHLLGLMIRKYLLDERQRERGSVVGGSQKKKKKRRKKKNGLNNSNANASGPVLRSLEDDGNSLLPNSLGANNKLSPSKKMEESRKIVVASPVRESEDSPKADVFLSTFSYIANPHIGARKELKKEGEVTDSKTLVNAMLDYHLDTNHKAESVVVLPPNRDLESFVLFLQERFHVWERTKQISSSSLGSNSTKAGGKSRKRGNSNASSEDKNLKADSGNNNVLPTVKESDVLSECMTASCRICRTSSVAHLRNLLGQNSKQNLDVVVDANSVILKIREREEPKRTSRNGDDCHPLAVPVMMMEEKYAPEDVERAFDYVAMEEGGVVANPLEDAVVAQHNLNQDLKGSSLFKLTFRLIHGEGEQSFLRLVLPNTLHNNDNGTCSSSFPLSLSDVRDMARHVLLPCGYPRLGRFPLADKRDSQTQIVTLTPDILTPTQLTQIQHHNQNTTHQFQTLLSDLKQFHSRFSELYNDAASSSSKLNSPSPKTFDVSTSSALQSCDSETETFLTTLLKFLLLVTDLIHHIFSSHVISPMQSTLIHTIQRLWSTYHTTLSALIEPTLLHRGRVMQLSTNRPGVVPLLYLDAHHRFSYCQMLDTKVGVLGQFMDELADLLLGVEGLEGLDAFCTVWIGNGKEGLTKEDQSHEHDQMNNEIRGLLKLQQELVCHTIHRGKVHDVVKVQTDRFEALQKHLAQLDDIMTLGITENNFLEQKEQRWFQSEWEFMVEQRSRIGPLSLETSSSLPSSCDKTVILNIYQHSVLATSQWRLINLLQYRHRQSLLHTNTPIQTVALSPCLQNWLTSPHQTLPQASNTRNTNHPSARESSCHPDAAQRRVHAILVSFLYRWLERRCDEWHADLTRKELLSDEDAFVAAAAADVDSAGKKSSKKKNGKKKRKSKNNQVSSSSVEASASTTRNDTLDNGAQNEPPSPKENVQPEGDENFSSTKCDEPSTPAVVKDENSVNGNSYNEPDSVIPENKHEEGTQQHELSLPEIRITDDSNNQITDETEFLLQQVEDTVGIIHDDEYDENGEPRYESAQSYLTRRLLVILDSKL